ncbi:rho GTPase-activating protein 25 [Chanos chanos]|uniref:Rho GTPase-activating protein 24 n=1 Tax=Chanos chanos TaxID=29144 RepID=A0A6J2WTX4_CHACN|nr:rho GTPase-activating protein 25 [Chanos chanos]
MSLKLPRNWDFSTFRAETAKIARSKSVLPGEGSPGSSRSGLIKCSMEKPLKAGWLKKQRSIVKNWQLRYFVLRANGLTYYKDDKESTVQGTIPLWSSKVNELPSNTDDKFLFEIVPRGSGDREKDAYVLMATSQSEMEEWVRCIRRAMGVPSSGVFGKSLPDIIAYEKKFGPHLVPILVEKCADFIREHGLNEEGIFRLPGQENQVKQFREAFDAGERPSFPSDTDVHTVASLLKLYLRELPEPVIPWTQYQDFLDSSLLLDPSTAAGRERLEKQISLLPRVNYSLLSYVCRFLYEVQQNSKVNKMSVENLATVMGVNLFKPQVEDAISMMKGTPMIQKVMTVMIRHHELLFPPSKDIPPSPPPSKKTKSKKSNAPRSFVGWESAECEVSSTSESPEEEDADTPETKRRDAWAPGIGSEASPSSPTSPSDSWSPRKRTQTLPSLGCPTGTRAGIEAARNRWSRIQESFEESDEKTLSEDIFKILDLQSVSLFSGAEGSGGGGRESRRESDVTVTQIDSPKESPEPKPGLEAPREETKQSPVKEEPPGHSPGLTTVPAPQPVQTQDQKLPAAEDAQQLIHSLQQRVSELTATVTELQSTLDAEKRLRNLLEVRLRNAERSRDEAQRRNEELDREIQQFLTGAGNNNR